MYKLKGKNVVLTNEVFRLVNDEGYWVNRNFATHTICSRCNELIAFTQGHQTEPHDCVYNHVYKTKMPDGSIHKVETFEMSKQERKIAGKFGNRKY